MHFLLMTKIIQQIHRVESSAISNHLISHVVCTILIDYSIPSLLKQYNLGLYASLHIQP